MATDIENDLNPDVTWGLSFPLSYTNNNGFFPLTNTKLEQAYHNLTSLLRTHPGERLGNPTFGCRLYQLLFEPMGIAEGQVEEAIREAVDNHLSYIVLHNIDVNMEDGKPGALENPSGVYVHITYSVNTDLQNQAELDILFTQELSQLMSHQAQQEWDESTETWLYTDEADPFYEY